MIRAILEIFGRLFASSAIDDEETGQSPSEEMVGGTLAFVVIMILVFIAAVWRFAPAALPGLFHQMLSR